MYTSEREMEYMALRRFLRDVDEGEGTTARRLKKALHTELTPRQREYVERYYLRQMRMQDIAEEMGVNVSTVSRTIKRGRARLHRCLRYGGGALLRASLED